MKDLFENLALQQIKFDDIYIDASLLSLNEALYLENGEILMQSADFHGAIPLEFISFYAPSFDQLDCYSTHPITASWSTLMTVTLLEEPSLLWLAKRAIKRTYLDLCQGEFIKKQHRTFQYAPRWAAYLAFAWVVTFFLCQGVQLYRLHALNHSLHTQIMTQYQHLFPSAKHVVNPKFQLTQYLKKTQTLAPLWQLIDTLGVAMMPITTELQSLNYQNKMLTLTLQMKDFKALETFESSLKKLKLKVHQLNANQQKKVVQATLELAL